MNISKQLKLVSPAFFIAAFLSCVVTIFAQEPTIFAPGVISGPAHEASPAFTPDGKTVYFSRGSAIMISHLGSSGKWSEPRIAPFSGEWADFEPTMAPDGSFLIFISSRPADGKGKQIDGFYNGSAQPGHGGNIWRVDLTGTQQNKPVRLPNSINRSGSVYAPSVVRDGSIYFMEASGEKSRFRLFRSQFAGGTYQTPKPLPFSTGEFTDVDPAVAADESFAVFSSSRPPAQSNDLFIVFRKNDVWGSTPLHMGTEINSPGSETESRLSPDSKIVYFSSGRTLPINFPRSIDAANRDLERLLKWDNGNNNIWQFSLTDWLKNHQIN